MKRAIVAILVTCAFYLFWYFGTNFDQDQKKVDEITTTSALARGGDKSLEEAIPDAFNQNIRNALVNKVLDKSGSVIQRTKDILALRKIRLTRADEEALINHLTQVHTDEPHTITNDIIEHLTRYSSDKQKVGNALLNILNNSNQDRVVREYVLQYVPPFYTSRWKFGNDWSEEEEADRQLFNSTLWAMTDLTEGSMAGGALFSLFKIAPKYADIDQNSVFEKSHQVLLDPSYTTPNRMGAVQILAFSNREEHFETAKQIVLSREGAELLQVTAIHTAFQSKFVDQELLEYITQLSSGKLNASPALKKCAQLTIYKFKR